MNVERFFNSQVYMHEMKRPEEKRISSTPVTDKRKTQKKYTRKVSTPDIDFTERQMQIAIEALQKGKP